MVKLQLNSVLSNKDTKFACYDISNFYLGMLFDRSEYIHIRLSDIPLDFIDQYNLTQYAHDGWIYFEINKYVYGLKQASKLANDLLTDSNMGTTNAYLPLDYGTINGNLSHLSLLLTTLE